MTHLTVSISLLLLSACQSPGGVDLTSLCPPPEFQAVATPLAPVHVTLGSDQRPLEESGSRDILGRSFVDGTILLEPLEAAFLRVLARDLTLAGVSTKAAINPLEQPLVLRVDMLHGGASYAEGPESLLLVFPTSSLEARLQVRLRLKDRLGRTFLDEEFGATRTGSSSLVGGPERQALQLLAEAMRETVDLALPRIEGATERFFQHFK